MHSKSTLLLVVALACFAAGTSLAANEAPKPAAGQKSFASLDDDHDGAISRSEASELKQLLVDFDRIDLDRDDKLEPAEYASFYPAGYR
jgi:hypothetical protein